MEPIRVVLIGKTGADKNGLGNILLGEKQFKPVPSSESVTTECEVMTGMLPCGRQIKVVDTPGIMDIGKRDVLAEVTKAIAALSPGPHAFIIVLQPGRATEEEQIGIKLLKELLGDQTLLEHTMIVMTRKANITDENEDLIDIHSFIDKIAAPHVKQLYEKCGRRIVAVENIFSSQEQKHRYAKEVTDEVLQIGGHYSLAHFKLYVETKFLEKEAARLRRELKILPNEQKRDTCSFQ